MADKKAFDPKSPANTFYVSGRCYMVPKNPGPKNLTGLGRTTYHFCSDGDNLASVMFLVVHAFEQEEPDRLKNEAVIMNREQLEQWANKVLTHPLAHKLAPHQALPENQRTWPAERKKKAVAYGPAVSADRRDFLSHKSQEIWVGSASIEFDGRGFYRFKLPVFSFLLACELAAYVLRDASVQGGVPELPVRQLDDWAGSGLAAGVSSHFPTLAERAAGKTGEQIVAKPVSTAAPAVLPRGLQPKIVQVSPSGVPASVVPSVVQEAPAATAGSLMPAAESASTGVHAGMLDDVRLSPNYNTLLTVLGELATLMGGLPKDGRVEGPVSMLRLAAEQLAKELQRFGFKPNEEKLLRAWMAKALERLRVEKQGVEDTLRQFFADSLKGAEAKVAAATAAMAEVEAQRAALTREAEQVRALAQEAKDEMVLQAEIDCDDLREKARKQIEQERTERLGDIEARLARITADEKTANEQLDEVIALIGDLETAERRLQESQAAVSQLAEIKKTLGLPEVEEPPATLSFATLAARVREVRDRKPQYA